jgi:hypothetical protein
MQPINPSSTNIGGQEVLQSVQSLAKQVLRWAQSVYKVLNGAVAIAQPAGQAAGGVYNKFTKDNLDCVLLYIGAVASGSPLLWTANNTGQAFNHGLLRQPIGFIVVYKSAACDVYSTVTPTSDNITLATTNDAATTIIMVF